MGACGKFVTKVIVKDGQVVDVARNRCGCRGCSVCDALHAADVKRALKVVVDERFDAGARFSMITLTIPHKRSDDLAQLVDWMFEAVKRFQRSAAFRRHVKGYVRGMEITWNAKNGFNPHFHILVESDLWQMAEIKALWTRCMASVGGPQVPPHGTHVMELTDRGQGLNEVLGYPFKIRYLTDMPGDEVCRLLVVTKGRHLAQLGREWSRRIAEIAKQAEATQDAIDDAEGRLLLAPGELLAQVISGNRTAFELLVQAAQHLANELASWGVAARLGSFLRHEAEEHGWPMPELRVNPEAGAWVDA
jgi:hypothetical protein